MSETDARADTQQGSMHCNPRIESCVNRLGFGLSFHMVLVLHSATHTHTHTLQVSQPVYLACVVVSDGHISAKPCVSMCAICVVTHPYMMGPFLQDGPLPIHILGCLATMGLQKRGGLLWRGYTSVHPSVCSFFSLCCVSKTFFSFVDFLILLCLH